MSTLPVQSHAAPSLTPAQPPRQALRRGLASASALFATGAFAGIFLQEKSFDAGMLTLLIPLAGLMAASILIWRTSIGAQILVRAFCWSALIFGVVLSGVFRGSDAFLPIGIAWGAGGALLFLGSIGLRADATSVFHPAGYVSALTAGLVMAIADLQTLSMWGGLAIQDQNASLTGLGMLIGAAVMFTAIIGMYRLQMWGVVLNLVANVGIAVFALCASELPGAIAGSLVATAVAQLLLPLPMLLNLWRKRQVVSQPSSRWMWLVPGVISALMITSVALYDCGLFD